ncbi:hypothetical protein E2C01_069173 [Portunus trituberculatus]|uniref:Uncharacterized protein n=1 Tax=Portunus trituberculatus TaxID=210409 RepID=A0A5B7I1G8_PORTR|nr:hypothetical protein [Portunus trituberculatus]
MCKTGTGHGVTHGLHFLATTTTTTATTNTSSTFVPRKLTATLATKPDGIVGGVGASSGVAVNADPNAVMVWCCAAIFITVSRVCQLSPSPSPFPSPHSFSFVLCPFRFLLSCMS